MTTGQPRMNRTITWKFNPSMASIESERENQCYDNIPIIVRYIASNFTVRGLFVNKLKLLKFPYIFFLMSLY